MSAPDVDRAKPARILTDILSLKVFGFCGWSTFTRDSKYLGPLPQSCGHRHEEQMIGELPDGGWATAHSAMYPGGMCKMFALRIFNDPMSRETRPFGRGKPAEPAAVQPPSMPKNDHEPSSSNLSPVRQDLMHIRAHDIRIKTSIIPQGEVDRATEEMNKKGADRPQGGHRPHGQWRVFRGRDCRCFIGSR